MAGLGTTMLGLSVLIQRRHAQICAEHDLTPAQALLLCMLKERPRGMKELAQGMGLERPGLTGLVIRAEKLGLVQRDTHGLDRRAVTVSTTPLGQKSVESLYAAIDDCVPEVLAGLPAADRATFERLLNTLAGALEMPLLFTKPGAMPDSC
ncbi:MarR family winged helix-turn-helix transcriptional regulator [Actinoplanes sp. TFC3]|uniref:MarR family winged helix-turn-helix transcriptional regulator n=1 Tax=Actinoplanes sp. TFC3 TaxID=1710355 RepID=UPI0008323CCE|nr:MarR family transcriptional regulator [Actinoplanes sp. TFC3]